VRQISSSGSITVPFIGLGCVPRDTHTLLELFYPCYSSNVKQGQMMPASAKWIISLVVESKPMTLPGRIRIYTVLKIYSIRELT